MPVTVTGLVIVAGLSSLTKLHFMSLAVFVTDLGNALVVAAPELIHSAGGVVTCNAFPEVTYVAWYWVVQVAVSVIGLFMITSEEANWPV